MYCTCKRWSLVSPSKREGETPQQIPTSYSGCSGFRSTQRIQGTTAYRYNTFILNFMANPMIYCGHYKFPYISLYLESPHSSPQAWATCVISVLEIYRFIVAGIVKVVTSHPEPKLRCLQKKIKIKILGFSFFH